MFNLSFAGFSASVFCYLLFEMEGFRLEAIATWKYMVDGPSAMVDYVVGCRGVINRLSENGF